MGFGAGTWLPACRNPKPIGAGVGGVAGKGGMRGRTVYDPTPHQMLAGNHWETGWGGEGKS